MSVPIPLDEPIALVTDRERYRLAKQPDPQRGRCNDKWIMFFNDQAIRVGEAPTRVSSASVSSQTASIGATDFSGGAIAAGWYRVWYFTRVTRAASSSSSLTVTFDFTIGGVALSYSGTALTGNTTGTWQSAGQLIRVDQNSPVRYSTTYASAGGTTMQYALDLLLEKVTL